MKIQTSKNKKKNFLHFIIGCFTIYFFIFQLIPVLTSQGKTAEIIDYINENNIDATPLFYTESEEAGTAIMLIQKQ